MRIFFQAARAHFLTFFAVLTAAALSLGMTSAIWPATAEAAACPCTIWSPATTPGTLSDPDAAAVELGVKFQADVSGFITGLRFYKSTANTGTHAGSLWTSTSMIQGTSEAGY